MCMLACIINVQTASAVTGQEPQSVNEVPKYYPDINFGTNVFSKSGSWMVINHKDKSDFKLMIKTLRSSAISYKMSESWAGDYFTISLLKDGVDQSYKTTATPWNLELKSEGCRALISFMDENTIQFSTEDCELRLTPLQKYSWMDNISTNEMLLCPTDAGIYQHFKTQEGTGITKQTPALSGEKGTSSLKTEFVFSSLHHNSNFAFREEVTEKLWKEELPHIDQTITKNKEIVEAWMKKMPAVSNDLFQSGQTAWYLLHAFQVAPAGNLTRRTILSSKNSWLTSVWSWDNCFHALAVASADPQLAWDQLFVFFDQQADNGMLPDRNNDLKASFTFAKPPVYGWTIRKLIEICGYNACKPFLKEAYDHTSKLTNYWYTYRDNNKNGMCSYRHGNDSGWDNATPYMLPEPVEGSDLAAYLIIQQQELADLAHQLGYKKDAEKWKQGAESQFNNLMKYAIKNGRFISPRERDGIADNSESLINYIPIMLGKQIPSFIRKNIVSDLHPDGDFLTPYGLASESLKSSKYEYDGYWRGPVWAPPTYQIFCGLLEAGETDLAKTIAQRYCNNLKNHPTFNENYSATDGKPLQAPGVSWTPAVFILLAHWLNEN